MKINRKNHFKNKRETRASSFREQLNLFLSNCWPLFSSPLYRLGCVSRDSRAQPFDLLVFFSSSVLYRATRPQMLWGCACTASSLSITTGPQHFLFFSSLKIIHSPPSLSRSPLPYSMLGQSLFFVSFLLLLLSFPPLEEEEDKENWCRASGCDCVSVLFSLVSLGVFWLLLSPARLGNRQTNVGIGCQQPPTLSLSAFLYYPPPAVLPRR